MPAPVDGSGSSVLPCMNKKVVITGTALSLLKIFQQSEYAKEIAEFTYFLGYNKKHGTVTKDDGNTNVIIFYFFPMMLGTAITYSFLQHYVSEEKDKRFQTLNSLYTMFSILFQWYLLWNLPSSKYQWTLQIIGAMFTIFTLSAHKRGINQGYSILPLLLIEAIILIYTLVSKKIGTILLVLIPFAWDTFEKAKRKQENKESEKFTIFNTFLITMLIFILFISPFFLYEY